MLQKVDLVQLIFPGSTNKAGNRGKGDLMDFKKKSGLLVGAGFLLGSVGIKALTSNTAKKCYVQGVAKGLQAKSAYEGIVEQAKAEVDDIVAEANYINVAGQAGTESAVACEPEAEAAQAPKKTGK